MTPNEFLENRKTSDTHITKVCDLRYLSEMMGGKSNLVVGVIDTFIKQIPEELHTINEAIEKNNFPVIKSFSHTMKSSVSIMGITILTPILIEMQNLGEKGENIERIKELNITLQAICNIAIQEIITEKTKYT